MNIHLRTLGCRLNEAELQSWAEGFQKAGHRITRKQQDADLIIINSCAVTQDAARKSRQLIRRVHRDNPKAKLVVSGCYATLNQQEATELMGVDLVVSNQDKEQMVEIVLAELDIVSMPAMSTEPGAVALFNRGRQRAFVKVQDGCRYHCTFCIVTVARGAEVSRQIDTIIAEIIALEQQGIKEVILTGVHLGGYGNDINSNLAELLTSILEKTNIPRIRLGSLEPWDLPENFFTLFTNPRLMPHLHLPLQCGSDSVLRRMARRCKTGEYTEIISKARQQIPHFNLTTDIIVGFPGETEQEWQESINFIKQTGFGHIHIFTYSPRADTKAASLPNPVPDTIKKLRSQQLHRLAAEMKKQTLKENLGQEFPVLWEGNSKVMNNGNREHSGYTPNYLRVKVINPSQRNLENSIIPVRLNDINQDYLITSLPDELVTQ